MTGPTPVPVRLTEKSSPSPWFAVSLMVNEEVSLKTPGPVSHTYVPIMIEADADAFVDEVLVA